MRDERFKRCAKQHHKGVAQVRSTTVINYTITIHQKNKYNDYSTPSPVCISCILYWKKAEV
jgi:hypothetical protein